MAFGCAKDLGPGEAGRPLITQFGRLPLMMLLLAGNNWHHPKFSARESQERLTPLQAAPTALGIAPAPSAARQ